MAYDRAAQGVVGQMSSSSTPIIQDNSVQYRVEYTFSIKDDEQNTAELVADITDIHDSWSDGELRYKDFLTLVDSTNVPWSEGDTEMQATFEYDESVFDESGTGGQETAKTEDWFFCYLPYVDLFGNSRCTDCEEIHELKGDASSGGVWLYYGNHETYTRSTSSETVRLILPNHIEIKKSEVLNTLETLSVQFDVDGRASHTNKFGRTNEVTCFATPAPVRRGGSALNNSFWVGNGSGLSTWAHEYVHTRQNYFAEWSLEWTIEGFADYYGHQLAWRHGPKNYPQLRKKLELGLEYEDTVLAEIGTWEDFAEYRKGALVAAALDAEIQQETDGSDSLETAFKRLNNRTESDVATVSVDSPTDETGRDESTALGETPVRQNKSLPPQQPASDVSPNSDSITGEQFQAIVEDITGTSFDSFFESYVRGAEVPEIPDPEEFPKFDTDFQWAFETGGSVDSSPTIVDDTVYVGSDDNTLYAIDASEGTEQWAFETGGPVKSSPTVVDGTVHVGSRDNNLYAIDASEGTEQWAFETGDVVESSPTVVGDTVYVGSIDGNLYAVDASEGTEQWAFETGGSVDSSPTVADGTVYVGSLDDTLYAVDASDGTQQWAFETDGYVESSPTVVDGTVYVGSWDNNLYAVDASDGTQQWAFETGSFVDSSPTVVDGTVYVGSDDYHLYAVDANTGTEQWAFETDSSIGFSSPTVADGTVYIASYDGNLYAIDASEGTELWDFGIGGLIDSSPTVVDGTVYVGGHYNYVYAVDESVEGSSEGSRVNLGTLGHHHVWGDDQSQNNPPQAEAGTDQTVEEGATVTLDGTGSTDPDGDSLSYAWTQNSGPNVSQTEADTATPEFTAPDVDSETTLTFELTVDDGQATDTDSTTVVVRESGSVSEYANDNGIVDTAGLRTAIADWRDDDIGTDLLREVIAAWRSGEAVE
jgi:outer membrane protein assembly factor BamB